MAVLLFLFLVSRLVLHSSTYVNTINRSLICNSIPRYYDINPFLRFFFCHFFPLSFFYTLCVIFVFVVFPGVGGIIIYIYLRCKIQINLRVAYIYIICVFFSVSCFLFFPFCILPIVKYKSSRTGGGVSGLQGQGPTTARTYNSLLLIN